MLTSDVFSRLPIKEIEQTAEAKAQTEGELEDTYILTRIFLSVVTKTGFYSANLFNLGLKVWGYEGFYLKT